MEQCGVAQGRSVTFETKSAVTVGSSWTDLFLIDMHGRAGSVSFEIENTGDTNAITDFQVLYRPHERGAWAVLLSGSDFDSTNLDSLFHAETTGPHECPKEDTAAAIIVTGPVNAIKFQAKSASGTTAKLRGTASNAMPV